MLFVKLFITLFLNTFLSPGWIPTFEQVKASHPASVSVLLDRQGLMLQESRMTFKEYRYPWVALDRIPQDIVAEVVKLEDQRFYQHDGVDSLALISALKSFAWDGAHLRGASTISMQLFKLLHKNKKSGKWAAKFIQLSGALQLERNWEKSDILESYLNLVPGPSEVVGLPSIARSYFGRPLSMLNQAERAWLYALIPSPNEELATTQKRACRYGLKLWNIFSCQDLAAHRPSLRRGEMVGHAPHLMALAPKGKETSTSINLYWQKEAKYILRDHLKRLEQQNVRDGAIIVSDRKTGEILIYVGSSDELSKSRQIDHIRARRQAGSTLKPFLYALAIQKKYLSMSSKILDEPFTVADNGLTYAPENYNRSYLHRPVQLKSALGSSLNIPAVRTLSLIGVDAFYNWLADFNLHLPAPADFYGHSLALGSADVRLWDLAQAYALLGQSGEVPAFHFFSGPKQILKSPISSETSFIIQNILSEKSHRSLSFGLDSILSTSSWSAVKTGTSKDMRDNWCLGLTDRYVIGIWVGNSSGEPMWNVLGVSGAGPLFRDIFELIHQNSPSTSPLPPKNLIQKFGNYYLTGTEPQINPDTELDIKDNVSGIILSPQNGAVYAYDPEIPETNQRLPLASNLKASDQLIWKLGDRILGQHEIKAGITPKSPGHFVLSLYSGQQKLDQISFWIKNNSKNNL